MTVVESPADSRSALLVALRDHERFLLVTHENPDGDALGSLLGMDGLLRALGKDSVMYMPVHEFPLPYEYGFLDVSRLVTDLPADLESRTLVFLDCGTIDRIRFEMGPGPLLNIDHHHDNTRFGTINHVVANASCTAEIVWDLMRALGVEPTPAMADALYVGLVTDTGRFMYANTGAPAHLMAADLVAVGVDVHAIYRNLYEETPESKLTLLGRALSSVRRYDEGALTFARLHEADFTETGALESYTEGIIDHLRAVRGTRVAALARETPEPERRGSWKVSLRSADGAVDVSVIARQGGGGGHRQAAGFTTSLEPEALVAFLREGIAAQLTAA